MVCATLVNVGILPDTFSSVCSWWSRWRRRRRCADLPRLHLTPCDTWGSPRCSRVHAATLSGCTLIPPPFINPPHNEWPPTGSGSNHSGLVAESANGPRVRSSLCHSTPYQGQLGPRSCHSQGGKFTLSFLLLFIYLFYNPSASPRLVETLRCTSESPTNGDLRSLRRGSGNSRRSPQS